MKNKPRKTVQLNIRVSPQDKGKLEKFAQREDMSLSKYLVACGLDCGEETRK